MSSNINYQETLNLPKTDFSMRAGLVNKEPAMLESWAKNGLYQRIREKSKGKTPFILHDGPPYANGNIHIGHALNKILKDIIVKYKTLKGFDSLYVPGWDCHGLPIEHQLLKQFNLNKHDVDPVEFREKAHDYAMKYVDIQKEQFIRLGIMGQWDKPYLTLAREYEYNILKSLSELTKKGYIYRSLKPVNWVCTTQTAVAESEIEYQDHTSLTVYVKFNINNPEAIGLDKKASLLVWTTTPWTLLANVAVAANKDLIYVCAKQDDEIIILEKSLSEKVLSKGGLENIEIVKELFGEELTSLTYTHPFEKLENCPVVLADYVTNEDGTGLVHTAPGHGQDDYQTGLKHKLDILMPVDERGCYTSDGAPFEGKHVLKVNPKVAANLDERGLLFAQEKVQHQYPYDARTKEPIIFRATEQWFLNVEYDGLRDKLQNIVESDVQWVPSTGQERILGMVKTRPDWCLSRQRYWGVPIPALIDKTTGQQKLYPEVIDHLAEIVKEEGSDAWFKRDVKDLIPEGFKDPETGSSDFTKTDEVLDVWFDSGVSHRAVFDYLISHPLPANLYLEGSDQHRGWFQSSLIPSVALDGVAPYKQVLTHGFVVDGDGRKMSKSLGNVIAPEKIIKQNGADILRLWVSSCNYHDDIRLSQEIMARIVDGYRKIRNTMRYVLGNLNEFDPNAHLVEYDQLLPIDQWALHQLHEVIKAVDEHYDAYRFSDVYKSIYHFCNETLSSIYLDILKDRLYTSSAQGHERRCAQTVLYYIGHALAKMLAPILVFTSEEMFSYLPKTDQQDGQSVHESDWPISDEKWYNKDIVEQFSMLIDMRQLVLKKLEDARKEEVIGSSLEAKVILETASDRDFSYFDAMQSDLPTYFITSQVELVKVDSVDEPASDLFAQTGIKIVKASGEKCPRCWKYKTDIGEDLNHPTICLECVKAITGS